MSFAPPRPYTVTAVVLVKCENCGAPEQPAGRPCHYCQATVREMTRGAVKPPPDLPDALPPPRRVQE